MVENSTFKTERNQLSDCHAMSWFDVPKRERCFSVHVGAQWRGLYQLALK